MGIGASSLATGLLIAASTVIFVTILILCIRSRSLHIRRPIARWLVFTLSLIIIHFFLASLLVSIPQDVMRFITSIAILLMLSVAALIIASSLYKLSQISVRRVVCFILYILIVNAILSITGVDYFGVGTGKPTFLFAEPSHFALIVAPFLIYYVRSRFIGWRWTLLLFVTYAIFIENMTMMMVVLLAVIASFRLGKLGLILPFLLIFIFAFANTEYFISRLLFPSIESDGSQFNLFDGGTTAAKILGEFGFIGALFISILIMRAFKAFLILRHECIPTDLFLFASCVDLGILIELFVRGVGYFSPTIFMYLVLFFCTCMVKTSTLPSDDSINKII
jgi:hypothetical protein